MGRRYQRTLAVLSVVGAFIGPSLRPTIVEGLSSDLVRCVFDGSEEVALPESSDDVTTVTLVAIARCPMREVVLAFGTESDVDPNSPPGMCSRIIRMKSAPGFGERI